MRNNPTLVRSALLLALAGAAAPIASTVIADIVQGASMSDAFEYASFQPDRYLPISSFSALTWVLAGLWLEYYGPGAKQLGWALRFVVTLVMTNIPQYFLSNADTLGHISTLLDFPPNVIAILKAATLFGLASWLRKAGGLAAVDNVAWTRSPPIARGAHQVTRLLCGHSILGGFLFRQQVVGYFDERWKAVAPEFGVDMPLVLQVAAREQVYNDRFRLGFGAIGILYLLVYFDLPEIILVPLAGSAVLYFVKAYRARARAKLFGARTFALDRERNAANEELEPNIATALPRDDQNLIVYSGFNPFVGCGAELGGWSVATFIDKPKHERSHSSVRPFTTIQLYSAITDAVAELGISELSCRDLFFASGTDIRDDNGILWGGLEGRPRQSLSDVEAQRIIASHDQRIRHYKCIQVIDWGGDLILSYFLRCEIRGRSLLIETQKFLLPPLANEYRSVDCMAPDGWPVTLSLLVKSLFVGPLLSATAPLVLFLKAQEAIGAAFHSEESKTKARRKAIEQDPTYDYGAGTTLRATFAQNLFQHHFQKSDADLSVKLIERKILDELVSFLDEHGIDTSDLRERTTTILNSGILVQGGDIRADSLAVGSYAQATTNTTRSNQKVST